MSWMASYIQLWSQVKHSGLWGQQQGEQGGTDPVVWKVLLGSSCITSTRTPELCPFVNMDKSSKKNKAKQKPLFTNSQQCLCSPVCTRKSVQDRHLQRICSSDGFHKQIRKHVKEKSNVVKSCIQNYIIYVEFIVISCCIRLVDA